MKQTAPRDFRILSFTFLLFAGFLALPDAVSKEEERKREEKSEVEKKAAKIIVPQVEFADTPIRDSVDFLAVRSQELDADETDAQKRGVNIVFVGDGEEVRISMSLSQVPLDATLQVVADLVDARLEARSEVYFINRNRAYDVVWRMDGGEALESQLRRIVVPSVEFRDTPVRDAVEFLQQRSVELDTDETGLRKGINVVLKGRESAGNVSFRLRNVSAYSALEALALAAGYQMEIREHLVLLVPIEVD